MTTTNDMPSVEQPPGTPAPADPEKEAVPATTHIVVAGSVAPAGADPKAEAKPAASENKLDALSLPPGPAPETKTPTSILVIDVGGTKVKMLATGHTNPRKASTGKDFTPARLVQTARELAEGWEYEAISIGYPGQVGMHGPRSEPGNLGGGWVGFDFAAAFGKPVKMINDAAMQALGSYEGGRMLFLGLGTGLGSTLITGHVIVPLELGQLWYNRRRTLGELLGRRGLEQLGKRTWRKAVRQVVSTFMRAFIVDYVVIGGGNAKLVKEPPPGARLGHNLTAFRGGFRLWSVQDVWVLAAPGGESPQLNAKEALRML